MKKLDLILCLMTPPNLGKKIPHFFSLFILFMAGWDHSLQFNPLLIGLESAGCLGS